MEYKSYHEEIKKEVEKLGYSLIATKPSNESHLRIVYAFSERKEEYVTWIYNVGLKGLATGHYFSYYWNKSREEARQDALNDFDNRK